jgi:asparagine synthase (glutamine-hydrolysing)
MPDYLVMCWTPGSSNALRRLHAVRAVLPALGLVKARASTNHEIWVRAARALTLHVAGGGRWLLIGDVFGDVQTLARQDAGDPRGFSRRLCERYWGAYIAVSPEAPGAPILFRDPSGALDCVTWRRDGVTFVASDFTADLAAAAPQSLSVDWACLGRMLQNPGLASDRLALRGLTAVGPGHLHVHGQAEAIWRPSDFIDKIKRGPPSDSALLAKALVGTIDGAVERWSGRYPAILAEISGGLDSAIIASSLARGRAQVRGWLNFHPPEAQADERRFAGLVAERNALALTFIGKPSIHYDLEALISGAGSARPGLNRVDHDYDDAVADQAKALGAQAILGGQGGDAVLYRNPDPHIAGDALARLGWPALKPGRLETMAWWTRTSVWTLLGRALEYGTGGGRGETFAPPSFMSRDVRAAAHDCRHPWVIDAAGAPPAKRVQVLGLSNCLTFHGPCARKRAAALIHPLLSQPVVELCLSLSTLDLSLGRGDRALARLAFQDRLPEQIVHRRTKGELGMFYGYGVCDSLATLRPLLLDGLLVEHGLVDRAALDQLLDPDVLISSREIMALITAAILEAWARSWTETLTTLDAFS